MKQLNELQIIRFNLSVFLNGIKNNALLNLF